MDASPLELISVWSVLVKAYCEVCLLHIHPSCLITAGALRLAAVYRSTAGI